VQFEQHVPLMSSTALVCQRKPEAELPLVLLGYAACGRAASRRVRVPGVVEPNGCWQVAVTRSSRDGCPACPCPSGIAFATVRRLSLARG
jgi:hypothetical protein